MSSGSTRTAWASILLAAAVALVSATQLRCGGGKVTDLPRLPRQAFAVPQQPSEPRVEPGPIPDFAPLAAIVTHADLSDMAPQFPRLLDGLLGARHRVDRRVAWAHVILPGETNPADDTLVWLRDYQPLFVRDADGVVSAVLYLSENPNRSAWCGLVPQGVRRRTLPLVHENGNLVTTGRYVFVTERILEDNAQQLDAPHLREQGYRPRRPDEVVKLLARALHRQPDDVIVLPAMPYEGTAHVDVFVLAVDESTVAIPLIEDEALALVGPFASQIGEAVRDFLDEQAVRVGSLGLEVVRLPMIPPAIALPDEVELPEDDEIDELEAGWRAGDADFDLVVFTPANALLVNAGKTRTVILPGFVAVAQHAPLTALIAGYTRVWAETFSARGWSPQVVDASELVSYQGLLRCTTATLPL